MSIIHNALKKTQAHVDAQNDASEKQTVEQKKPSTNIYEKLKQNDPHKNDSNKNQKKIVTSPDDQLKPKSEIKQKAKPKPKQNEKTQGQKNSKIFLVGLAIILLIAAAGIGYYQLMPADSNPLKTATAPLRYKSKPFVIKDGLYEISGTIEMGTQRAVLINNDIYEIGDALDQYTIINVQKDSITLKSSSGVIENIPLKTK